MLYDDLKILSIGNLVSTGGKKPGRNRRLSFRHWKGDLIDIIMTGQSKFNEYFMAQVHNFNQSPVTIVRIPSFDLSPEQQKLIKMDNAEQDAINLIKGKGNDIGELWRRKEEIAQFFRKQKTYVF